jgi:predicted MPP superfamily phosphohydrolase
MARIRKPLIITVAILLAVTGVLVAIFYRGLTVSHHRISTEKVTSPVRILLITDLHSSEYGKEQSGLIRKIDAQSPDAIMLVGDIMDSIASDQAAIELFQGIADRYPCFYVTGNHEFWGKRVPEQKEMLGSFGVVVLEGNSQNLVIGEETVSIFGVDDPSGGKFKKQLETAAAAINPDQYGILLSHRPELLNSYAVHDFDLVLTGHAHGGHWRIPFLFPDGIFAPGQGWFPKFTRGIHDMNGTTMVVSRGLGRDYSSIPRIFNPPELVVIDIVPQ